MDAINRKLRCCGLSHYRYRSKEIEKEPLTAGFVFVFLFVILQPLLDIGSYFSIVGGVPNISFSVRTILLAVIGVSSVIVSLKKWHAVAFYGMIAVYWAAHMLVCLDAGYRDPVSDASYFIKVIQLPVYAFAFLQFFRRNPRCGDAFQLGATINIYIISLSLLLAAATNTMSHTYWYTQKGFLGWFYSGNAQSAILAALLPVALVYTMKRGKLFFGVTALLGFMNLFLIGTRVAYFSIFIIAIGMSAVFLFGWARRKKGRWIKGFLFLLAVLAVCAGGYTLSPMYQSRAQHERYTEEKTHREEEEQQITDQYTPYRELYQKYCAELVDTFGLESTLQQYDYTTEVSILSDVRLKKRTFAAMQWERKPRITHLFGYEYQTLMAGETSMEPENDFHVLFYLYGYVGMGLSLLSVLSLLVWAVKRLVYNRVSWSVSLWGNLLSGSLLLGSSFFAGHTLVRPNVSVYFSFILALSLALLGQKGKAGTPDEGKHFAR